MTGKILAEKNISVYFGYLNYSRTQNTNLQSAFQAPLPLIGVALALLQQHKIISNEHKGKTEENKKGHLCILKL